MVAASISTFAAPGATAQTGAGGNNRVTAGKGQQPVTDKVIISHTPKFKSKAYSVLSRVLGKKEFETCASDKKLEDQVAQSRLDAAQQLGVNSTPYFFINGKAFQGEPTLDAFDQALSQAAQKS